MTENTEKTVTVSAEGIVNAYEESLEKPKLRKSLVNNLSAALDSNEKIKGHAERLNIDPEELKKILKK